tara:strand:- start:63304 stop:63678 length:375 start_codon:yes stop_codon:yes gene_type:complete
MSDRDEKLLDGLLRRALVPKGFRPRTTQAEDAMLEALGHVEISHAKQERMLQKIRGTHLFDHEVAQNVAYEDETAEVNEELAAMFRADGEPISPEIVERLSELERQATEEPEEDDEPTGSSDGS